jgi:UDP-2,3-diacylglucosamine pyrophosphatase LpxH
MSGPRSLILSDLHLGRPRQSARGAERLRPLWQGFDRVIFNGDVAEIHHPRHRTAAAREVVRLLDFCERDGVEPVILSGNHDPFISERRQLSLANGRIFITHGDVFHPAIAPWSPVAPKILEANVRAFRELQRDSATALEARLEASQHASHVEWVELERQARRSSVRGMMLRPWAILQVLAYWRRFPSIVTRFADAHHIAARYIVCGHTHHPGIWERDGRVIVNTGSFGFPGRPLAVVHDGMTLTVRRVRRDDEGFSLTERPMRIYGLDDSSVAHRAAAAVNAREGSGRPSAAAI